MIVGGCVGFGVILGTYSSTVLKDRLIEQEYTYQKDITALIGEVLKKNNQISTEKAESSAVSVKTADYSVSVADYLAKYRHNALYSFNGDDGLDDAMSILGVDYFLESKNQEHLFYTNESLPKSISCAPSLGLSEKELREGLNYIRKHVGDANKFKCFDFSGNILLGYVLPQFNKDKKYIFLSKITSKPVLIDENKSDKTEVHETVVQTNDYAVSINPSMFTEDGRSDVVAFDDNGIVLFSSIDNFDANIIPKTVLDNAKNVGSAQTFVIEKNTKDDLVTVSYTKDVGYAVAMANRGNVIRPAVIFTAIIAGLTFAILLMFIYVLHNVFHETKVRLSKVTDCLKQLSNNDLRDPESLSKITDSLLTKENNEYTQLYNTVGNLGKLLGEGVTSLIEATAKNNFNDAVVSTIRGMHQQVLPSAEDLPSSRFLDIATYLIPSRNTSCSDFYDVFRIDKDNIGIIIGQTSRKGNQSLRFMSETMVLCRKMLHHDSKRPSEALNYINENILVKNPDKVNVSLFVAILSEFTGNFIAANAGFQKPVIVHLHKAGEVDIETGPLLGEDSNYQYSDMKSKLDFGDMIVLISNGIKDAVNVKNEAFGMDRIKSMSEQHVDGSAADMLIKLNREVRTFAKDTALNNDMSAICIKKSGSTKERE